MAQVHFVVEINDDVLGLFRQAFGQIAAGGDWIASPMRFRAIRWLAARACMLLMPGMTS